MYGFTSFAYHISALETKQEHLLFCMFLNRRFFTTPESDSKMQPHKAKLENASPSPAGPTRNQ